MKLELICVDIHQSRYRTIVDLQFQSDRNDSNYREHRLHLMFLPNEAVDFEIGKTYEIGIKV